MNGKKDPYEDPAVPVEKRIDDLLGRMKSEGLLVGCPIHVTVPGAGSAD